MNNYERKKLKEIIPIDINGIFYYLDLINAPWQNEFLPSTLDLQMNLQYGERYASDLLLKLTNNNTLDYTTGVKLANILKYNYFNKWKRLYATYDNRYPILEDIDLNTSKGGTITKDINFTDSISITKAQDDTGYKIEKEINGSYSDSTTRNFSKNYSGSDSEFKMPEKNKTSTIDNYDVRIQGQTNDFETVTKTTGQVLEYNDNDTNLGHYNDTLEQVYAFNSNVPINRNNTHYDSRKITNYGGEIGSENEKPYTVTVTPKGAHENKVETDITHNPNVSGEDANLDSKLTYGSSVTDTGGGTSSRTYNDYKETEERYGVITNDETHSGSTHTLDETTTDLSNDTSGLSGKRTYQELINQEREVSDFNYFDVIIKDIINFITLPIY